MYGKLVKIDIKPGKRDHFLEFLRYDEAVARAAEPGTLRFDVWNVPHQPDSVYLYEAYTNPDAFGRHQSNEPYKRFVGQIGPELTDGQDILFDWTDSLISNSAPVSHTETDQPKISKLSIGSFPPTPDDLAHFNGYAELRRLARWRADRHERARCSAIVLTPQPHSSSTRILTRSRAARTAKPTRRMTRLTAGRRAVIKSSLHHWQSRLQPGTQASGSYVYASPALGAGARICRKVGATLQRNQSPEDASAVVPEVGAATQPLTTPAASTR